MMHGQKNIKELQGWVLFSTS